MENTTQRNISIDSFHFATRCFDYRWATMAVWASRVYRVSVISDICRKSDPITNEPRIVKCGSKFSTDYSRNWWNDIFPNRETIIYSRFIYIFHVKFFYDPFNFTLFCVKIYEVTNYLPMRYRKILFSSGFLKLFIRSGLK